MLIALGETQGWMVFQIATLKGLNVGSAWFWCLNSVITYTPAALISFTSPCSIFTTLAGYFCMIV